MIRKPVIANASVGLRTAARQLKTTAAPRKHIVPTVSAPFLSSSVNRELRAFNRPGLVVGAAAGRRIAEMCRPAAIGFHDIGLVFGKPASGRLLRENDSA